MNDTEILFDKTTRLKLADLITELQKQPHKSAERTLAFRALQSARHWLGEDLAILGAQNPYPNGNNSGTVVVDPPADVTNRRTERDGNWMDKDGACKVCDGEIPHGHTPNCDIFKLEQAARPTVEVTKSIGVSFETDEKGNSIVKQVQRLEPCSPEAITTQEQFDAAIKSGLTIHPNLA